MNRIVDLQINGMHCASCEMLIKEELSSLSGVKDISIDHKTGHGTVTLSNRTISDSTILESVKNAGYQASVVTTNHVRNGNVSFLSFPKEIVLEGIIGKNEQGQLT